MNSQIRFLRNCLRTSHWPKQAPATLQPGKNAISSSVARTSTVYSKVTKPDRVLTLSVRGFLLSVGLILAVTALGKLAGVFTDVPALSEPEPLLTFVTNRQIILLAAILELAILACLFSKRLHLTIKLLSVAWISTVFLAYRLSLWSIGYHGTCGCLGHITEALGISADRVDLSMKLLLFYLVIGSYFLCALLRESRTGEKGEISPAPGGYEFATPGGLSELERNSAIQYRADNAGENLYQQGNI
jgi:hypothetical protein